MRLLRPLLERDMALLWSALSLSAVGDQLYAVALSWIAVSVFGAAGGYMTALQRGIVVLAALGAGRWADRWEPQASLIGADLVRTLALLLFVAVWLASGEVSAVGLIAVVVVLAAGTVVFEPALQVMLPRLVSDRALLPAANALLDTTDRSARLLGPGLIALLAGLLPTVHFFTLDAATFLLSAMAVTIIRGRRRAVWQKAPRAGVWRALMRGTRAMQSHPLLGYVLHTTALVNGAWYTTYFLALPLLIDQLGLRGPGGSGLGAYGLVIACYGSTNLLATLVLGGRAMPIQPQWVMFSGTLIVGAGTVLLGLSALLPTAWVLPALAASAAVSAVGGPMKDILVAVLRQTRLAPVDLPAAMRAYFVAASGGALIALLIAPPLLRGIGTASVIVLCGVALAASAAVGLLRHHAWSEEPGIDTSCPSVSRR